MKIKTSEAEGEVLNWLVAYACVFEAQTNCQTIDLGVVEAYSTDWAQGGPIIDQMMGQGLTLSRGGPGSGNTRCWAKSESHPSLFSGPTTLIAAMRCFICSKLGEGVEVPDELSKA